MKTCTKCKVEKPVTEFHKCKGAKDGLAPHCKVCRVTKAAAAYAADPEKFRARSAAARAADPEKFRARSAEWTKANPEKKAAINRTWTKANPEKKSTTNRAWSKANPEKKSAGHSAWARANPGKNVANAAKHNAAKLQATPTWSDPKAIKFIYAQAAQARAHVDHIVPLRSKLVCGLHVEHNLQLLTQAENCSKGNRYWPDMPSSIGAAP